MWGQLERFTGEGLWAGRFLDLVLSFALVCSIAFAKPSAWPRSGLAATGLLLFPYTLLLAPYLYTDVMAAFFAALGTLAVLRRRPGWAFVAFSVAIATRQYLVQIPAAFVAAETLAWWRGAPERWKTALASAAAAGTLGGWFLFFGGLAPQAGLDAWIPKYPAPMLDPSAFILHYGLYALTGIGAYFVVVEAALFRELPARRQILELRTPILAIALGVLFVVDPPVLTASHPGGPLGRVCRILLPSPAFDLPRVGVYYVLALLAVLRFSRKLDAAFWVVAAGVVLSMKQQIPWEKYLLPTLSTLWLLRASGELVPYGAGDRTEATSNGFTKQSSPSPRFST